MEARIAKERAKLVERIAEYENDEYAWRWEFGSNPELDELEVAGGLPDRVEHRRHERPREDVANAGVLARAAQFQRPADLESQVEETNREDKESGFITMR